MLMTSMAAIVTPLNRSATRLVSFTSSLPVNTDNHDLCPVDGLHLAIVKLQNPRLILKKPFFGVEIKHGVELFNERARNLTPIVVNCEGLLRLRGEEAPPRASTSPFSGTPPPARGRVML